MLPAEGLFTLLGVSVFILCYLCFCCCTKRPSTSDLPQAPTGSVYFYDLTQATPPDESAPPPYHLAILYPPVNSHQQMNPPVYGEDVYV